MADCCVPGTGFPNATLQGQLATNYPVIWEEICKLQQAILAASSQCQPGGGKMCVTVGGTTPMTFVSGVLEVLVTNSNASAVPNYEEQVATAGQTVVNTTVNTVAMSGNTAYLIVFVNGVMQMEGASFSYTVTGPNQITFNVPLALNDDIAIYSYAGSSSIAAYEALVATAGQTVVNTTVDTIAKSGNTSYLLVFVNGVLQIEGTDYNVTGSNQLTFTSSLVLGDDVAIYSYAGGVAFSGGYGYYEDSPAVYFEPPNGAVPSIIATGTVVTNGSNITAINITNGGAGYQPVPATMTVISGTGVGADLQPLVNGSGNIVSVNIVSGGTGYVLGDVVTATRAVLPNIAYVNATFQITSIAPGGVIVGVAVLNPGSGYQDSVATPMIVSTLNPLVAYPLGTGFFGTVFTDVFGTITGVSIFNQGAGYDVFPPYLVIIDPGTGATTKVTLSGTSVASIEVLTPGVGYTPGAIGIVYNPPTAPLPNPPANPAVVDVVVAVNTFGTDPLLYWNVWQGSVTNKPIQLQMNAVLSYFRALGYTIVQQTNPLTGNTLQWKICW